jgi:hypothetical protein
MKRYHFTLTVLLVAATVCLSDCATIVSKTSYPVSIETEPSGVHVSITDRKGREIYSGKTPAALLVRSGAGFFLRAEYEVHLSARGYSEKVIPITFQLNGWYFGNLVFGGLIGMLIVDPISGAMWRIDKNAGEIVTTLSPSTASVTEPSLRIIDIKDVPVLMRKDLVRIK